MSAKKRKNNFKNSKDSKDKINNNLNNIDENNSSNLQKCQEDNIEENVATNMEESNKKSQEVNNKEENSSNPSERKNDDIKANKIETEGNNEIAVSCNKKINTNMSNDSKLEYKNAKEKVHGNESNIQNSSKIDRDKTNDKDILELDCKDSSDNKSLKKVTESKPEYVEKMIKAKKRKMYIFVLIILLVVLASFVSTFWALLYLNKNTFIGGVSIKNISIEGISKEEAIKKINEVIEIELLPEIKLKYMDYEVSLLPSQIEFTYKVEDAINDAYEIGRNGNILQNNYSILFSSILGNDTELKYTYNKELLDQFINDVESKIPGFVVEPTYYMENSKLYVVKGKDGIKVKKEELKQKILEAISNRKAEEMKDGFEQTLEISIVETKASKINMDTIYSEIHTEPKDAYFETEPYKIYADVDGVDLAISLEEAKKEIETTDKEEYVFNLKITKANKTINDLGTEAFPYLISSFSTKYDASNTNRSTNLRIAAEKINGKVLMPGEEFSYNKVVGKRTVEEGYKDAKIYADGGVVDGLAGGICQISSTLYNAVLFANLQVTERRNHSYTTSYVPAGRDATVVYGVIDFKFVNNRSYPIKIEASVKSGIAEFKIHGMQEETEYEVKILPVTTQSIPFTTQYINDPSLAPGQQIVSQSGHLGYKVTTYKELRLNGATVSKEIITNDTYQPMKTIIRRGAMLVSPDSIPEVAVQ